MPASNGAPSITEIRSFTRIISAAELLAFSGGAIQVVPPSGGGQMIWPISLILIYNFNTVDFSRSPQLRLQYSGSGIDLLSTPIANITGAAQSTFVVASLESASLSPADTFFTVGAAIDLILSSGAFALAGVGAASIGAAGTGYAVGDTGTITTGNGDATYRITSVGGLGDVTGFVITFPGSGYATGAGQATATGGAQPGVGINFTVDVNSLVNGDGTIKVTTLYQVIDVP